jgi:uncharacterized protein (TIGR03067 family)
MRIALLSGLTIYLFGFPVPISAQASTPAATIAAAPSCAAAPLAGTWDTVSLTFDGEPSTDDEMLGSRLTFTGDRLTIDTAKQSRVEFAVSFEPGAQPCALHLAPVSAPGEPEGWMLFALEGDRLRLGFHDNLRHRAASFESRPDMVVLRLSKRTEAR